ncbi:MAG: recombinase family protein [Dehalococcoidia bacterium]
MPAEMATRVVGYFRDDADGRDHSMTLAMQHERFIAFCRERGCEVAATFIDAAGEDDERSGFRQLLEYLRRQTEPTLVVIDRADRLGKDLHAAARAYLRLAAAGADVLAVTGDGDLLEEIVQRGGRGAREHMGERVRAAMRRKAIKGEVLGRPPYGYRVGTRHRLEVVPDEAPIVRYIFRLYNQEGLGIRLIARRLNQEGIRTRRGGDWSMVTIREILRNRVYLGTYARFGVRVPGSHQALIAPEDYHRAQDGMASRRTSGGPRSVSAFLLSGLAECGACGQRMIGVSRRQSWTRRDGGASSAEYRYYQCGSRTNRSVCGYHTHRVDDLDEAVRAAAIAELERRLREGDAAGTARPAEEQEHNRVRLHNLDREIDRVINQAAADEVTLDHLRAAGSALMRRRDEARCAARRPRGAGRRHAVARRRADLDRLSARPGRSCPLKSGRPCCATCSCAWRSTTTASS